MHVVQRHEEVTSLRHQTEEHAAEIDVSNHAVISCSVNDAESVWGYEGRIVGGGLPHEVEDESGMLDGDVQAGLGLAELHAERPRLHLRLVAVWTRRAEDLDEAIGESDVAELEEDRGIGRCLSHGLPQR